MEIGTADEDIPAPNERSAIAEEVVVISSPPNENGHGNGITSTPTPHIVNVSGIPSNIVVASASVAGILNENGEEIKTARIIIHDPSSSTTNVLKTPQPVTYNPLNRSWSVPDRNINWDPQVHESVLPVRCRNIKGYLHKNKFGSGNRGRCINVNESWYTPTQFEALCGRRNSKDWKRSIRYGGLSLQCLIDEGILRPHATCCSCSACCDDPNIEDDVKNGPIRLFTPYKRKKRQLKNLKISDVKIAINEAVSAPIEMRSLEETRVNGIISASGDTNSSDSVIVTPSIATQTMKTTGTMLDFNEQKQWWHLEEIAKNLANQAIELQKQIETLKQESLASREVAMKQLKIQLDNEKKEALNAYRLEAQLNLNRVIEEAKNEKEFAIEEALNQARLEMQQKLEALTSEKSDFLKRCANCAREAFSECTGCHNVSYCSTFCQRKDWQNHREECGETILSSEVCSELDEAGS